MPHLSREIARQWVDRWDRQQLRHLPDREDRFIALIDAVEVCAGRPDPLVIDLGCGPGSLSGRLVQRMPEARVIAVDVDPVLLELGHATLGHVEAIQFADVDLSVLGWSQALSLSRRADVAVSTTALHWIPAPNLPGMYKELANILKPGGVLLNGDELILDENSFPVLAKLEKELVAFEEIRRFPDGHPEGWAQWWDAISAEPSLEGSVAERRSRHLGGDHHGTGAEYLNIHVEALRSAGFNELGMIWQRGENKLFCAVLNNS